MNEHADPQSWRPTVAPRLIVVAVLFAVWVVAILARLVTLQIYQHDSLEAWARRQRTSVEEEPAQRGDLVDRHGRLLAFTVEEDTVCAAPYKLKDPVQAAAKLCAVFGGCSAAERAALESRLGDKTDKYYAVRHWVTEEQARRVAALRIDGIYLEKEPHRYYPNGQLAANLLGFVGTDNVGRAGLEARYEDQLKGRPGHVLVQRDGSRTRAAFGRIGAPPTPGATFELTIDAVLQHLVERELRAGVQENRAAGGCAVVMAPDTGEILAMASEPTFDPNAYRQASPNRWRNCAVQDAYEPGSTFKIVTGSAALEEHIMRPADLVETGSGALAVGPTRIIREAQGRQYGTLSFTDVFVKSSNVGAVKIGFRLGPERLGQYVERFGFGTRLSPDFPGENAGIVWPPSRWDDGALASVSMGYQVSVTPLQMAAAASAVANGGELIQPRVVRAVITGDRRQPVPRKVIRRVTSPATASQMTAIMEAVVEHGTGRFAALPDFAVAGKTGTAHKNRDGRYLENEKNVSFVGFVPSQRPALTILVLIDTPRGPNSPFGGTVAAPIFHRIADAALRHLGVRPTVNPVPPVLLARRGAADPLRVSGPALPPMIVPAAHRAPAGQIVLPELRGLGGREALRVLARLGITPRVAGEGVVVDQDPLPGSPIEPGGSCRLSLGRPAPGLRP